MFEKNLIFKNAVDAILKEGKKIGVESLFVVSTCNRAQFFAHTHNAFILKELYIKHSKASEEEGLDSEVRA